MDEDLKNKIMEYLQSKGKFVSAQDVLDCMSQPGVPETHHSSNSMALDAGDGLLLEKRAEGPVC